MTRKVKFSDLRHDAEVCAGREDGDCRLSQLEWDNAVLALVEAVEAARPIANYAATKQHPYVLVRCEEIDALADALARFDFGERP